MRNLFNYFTTTAVGLLFLLLTGCSGQDNRPSSEVNAENEAAASLGREQARRLAPGNFADSIEIETILIDVRVRESALRNEGEEELADTYLNAFLTELYEVNPSLSAEISLQ